MKNWRLPSDKSAAWNGGLVLPVPGYVHAIGVGQGTVVDSAHVVLRFCSKDDDGTTYLTPDCKTPEEFNYQIDRLQSELEIIRNRGIRAFIESINADKRKRKKK